MKKKLIILWPWYFKKKDWIKYEIDNLLKFKSFSINIHEMGNIIEKKLSKINRKKHRIIKRFNNINEWYKKIIKLEKKNKVYILNEIRTYNIKSFLLKKKLNNLKKIKKIIVLEYSGSGGPNRPMLSVVKNLHKIILNIIIFPSYLFNFFKMKILYFLDKNLNYYPNYKLLTSKKYEEDNSKSKIIYASSLDYSNNLIEDQHLSKDYKYAIYIDFPLPNTSDSNFLNIKYGITINKWFKSLRIFFNKIEKQFKLKILIFPHPKNNYKSLKRYYKNNLVINDTISKYSKNAEFFISNCSTALSNAVYYKKPIFLICSNELFSYLNYKDKEFYELYSNELGVKLTNIDSKENFMKNNINYLKYKMFKQKFLTSKKKISPNNLIIKKLISN